MKRTGAIALLLLAGAIYGCGVAGDGAESAEPEATRVAVTPDLLREGRTAYRKYCVQCHGYNGRGDGTSAANLDPPPRDHTQAEVMDAIDDRTIGATIRHGGAERGFPNMPAFPHVNDDEIRSLVAYVRSLSRPEVSSIDIGTID